MPNDWLNSLQRDGATEAVSLRRFAGILSGPVAFLTARASSTDWTSLTVSVNSDITGEAGALAALKLSFKFIQKFKNLAKKKKKRETCPQVARTNLGGPDLQLLKDKINIITVITIKDRTNRI